MSYRKIFYFYWVRAAKYKWYFFFLFIGTILHGIYPFVYSYSSKLIFDLLQDTDITFAVYAKPITIFCLAMFLLEISYVANMFAELKAYPHIHNFILTDIYDIVQRKQYAFFQKNQYGAITGKITESIYVFDYLLDEAGRAFEHLIIILINSVSLLLISWKMGVLVVLLLLIAFGVSYWLGVKITRSVRIEENSFYQIEGSISDRFINMFSILSFFSYDKEKHRLQNSIQKDFIPKQQRSYRYKFWMVINIGFFYIGITLISFIYAIFLKTSGNISIGDVSLIFGLAVFLAESMLETGLSLQSLLYEAGRIKSVFEVIDESDYVIDGDKDLTITTPTLEFKNVTFKYSDSEESKNVFDNFNLTINAGEHIGVIGESGVGKSSLISLILGLFKCDQGQILISGTNIKDISLKTLRDNIGIIPQDTILFNRPIMENLKYGSDCENEEVIEICKQVGLHDVIMSMNEQYNTFVGERGSKLSGGQRQRVSIVRAILKKAPILLLDEATSALDARTEFEIHTLINKIFKDVTMIVVAHRLTTIKNMDRIILLKKGKIFEDGTHEELYNKDSLYKKLWSI
ncbi:MAG: ABC transporter ATP-binding protein/permease [Cytophagales bacterium]|jgi:ATP-binding cassette subfamily B protein|nr:ABC transporter ATP-binding protein/permease [Cytophagales bacterium]